MEWQSVIDESELQVISRVENGAQEILICESSKGSFVLRSMGYDEQATFQELRLEIEPFLNHHSYVRSEGYAKMLNRSRIGYLHFFFKRGFSNY